MLALLAGCAAPQHIGVLGGVGNPVNTGQRDRIEADSADKPAASVAYGTTPPWVRTEAELGWRWSGLHGYNHGQHEESAVGDVHVFALTGNAWLQPPLEWRIVPYAGVGIGPALQIREGRSSITRTDLDQISGVFARQLGAGLRIGISKRLSADLGSPPFRGRRRRAAALPWRPRFRPGSVALNQLSRMRWQIPSEPLAHEQRQTKTGAAVRVCCAARRFS